jgi:hypothetical protein
MNDWSGVIEYCEKTNIKIKEIADAMPEDKDNKEFPWNLTHKSDHLPVSVNIPLSLLLSNKEEKENKGVIRVTTYNVLNKKYLKYLKEETDNRHQRLHTHPIAVDDKEHQIARERSIIDNVIIPCLLEENNTIVCLQEVSDTFLNYLLLKKPEETHLEITRKNSKTEVYDNCNVVIYNIKKVNLLNKEDLIADDTCFYTFGVVDTSIIFNIASVHLSWSATKNYGKIFLENTKVKSYPLIIAGDINKGVRYPISEDGAHLTKEYLDERFIFPLPVADEERVIKERPYSHVCHLRNVGGDDYRRMLDKFDHIFIMLPPP